jgi:hypothetical protein
MFYENDNKKRIILKHTALRLINSLVFQRIDHHTSGDFDEAIDWLRELDAE